MSLAKPYSFFKIRVCAWLSTLEYDGFFFLTVSGLRVIWYHPSMNTNACEANALRMYVSTVIVSICHLAYTYAWCASIHESSGSVKGPSHPNEETRKELDVKLSSSPVPSLGVVLDFGV